MKAREFFSKFINGTMSKWVAMNSIIEPSLIYPLVTTSYSPKQIGPIDSLTSQMKCLALGLSRKFPRAILHGPTSLGGMGIPSTSQKNTKERVNYFLYNVRLESSIGNKLEITIIYSQIEAGSFRQLFQLPFYLYSPLVSSSFCVQLWSELEPRGIILKPASSTIWAPSPLFNRDRSITDIIIHQYDTLTATKLNRCCIYLQIISIADLFIGPQGTSICSQGPRVSRIHYKSGQFFWYILFVVKKLLVKNILRSFFTTQVF
jgi:hypothetical protein